jgi:hypothetical protein
MSSRAVRVAAPVRGTLGLLWHVWSGAIREFVWADLRAGLIDLRGLAWTTRILAGLGFALLLAMTFGLLFNDLWRSEFDLLARTPAMPGRGSLLPIVLVPATLFLLALAWAFALTGALSSRPAIRLGVLALYLLWASAWTDLRAVSAVSEGRWPDLVGIVVLAAVPALFGLAWRRQPPPIVVFLLLLPLIGATLLLGQAREIENQRALGQSLMLAKLQLSVVSLQGLTQPLLLLLGLNIAIFTRQAAGWTTEIVESRLPRWALPSLLIVVLGWRLRGVLLEAMERVQARSVGTEILAYAGAFGVVAIVGVVWWLVQRGSGEETGAALTEDDLAEAAERHGPSIILLSSAVSLAVMVIVLVAGAFAFLPSMQPAVNALVAASSLLSNQVGAPWRWLVAVVAILGAVCFARRGQRPPASYLGMVGAIHLWYELVGRGRPLGMVGWRGPEPVDFWLVVVLAAVALGWLARGVLTRVRTERLLFLVLVTALFRQTDFIETRSVPSWDSGGSGSSRSA